MYSVVSLTAGDWITRPHEPGEPARRVSELSERAGFTHSRANVWRYEAGAAGKRHVHPDQEETFVVLAGAMTMHVGEPPEPVRVGAGELIHISAGTPLQIVNDGGTELVIYVYGTPPDHGADVLPDAI
jgi:mannose-6-phosphate isomerase-like protein (cupin superfamily)